ncbi:MULTISPECIES: VOC family protein [Nocardiaceae]|uniref:VOC family protein n=1 Tax=Nocardiaceae TaxID=85025 RepID=UPI0006894F02|nr:VOC family protein [Rhodococcus fascians]
MDLGLRSQSEIRIWGADPRSREAADVDAAYRAAMDAELEIVYEISNEEWGVRRFFFRDAGGNVVNVLAHM